MSPQPPKHSRGGEDAPSSEPNPTRVFDENASIYTAPWINDLIGQTLDGRYRVDEFIGQGAMGAVFRAEQLRLRRPVAIKAPHPDLTYNEEFLARFEREALTMAKVVHENVVQIIDVCVSQNRADFSYIVMEYVKGEPLGRFLEAQRFDLTVNAVLELLEQIARGIDAAHTHGIVHRDIKPGNIVVTMPRRIAKIMDFGLACAEMEGVFQTTRPATVGTPAYMAPEQVTGGEITPAADIYALAMTVYQLLTRQLPYDATTPTSLLYAHTHTAPAPIHERNPILPVSLSYVMARGLNKDAARRPATAAELVQGVKLALEPKGGVPYADLLRDVGQDTRTARPRLAPAPKVARTISQRPAPVRSRRL